MLLQENVYSDDLGEYALWSTEIFYYSILNSSIENISHENKLSIYPNPCTDLLNIDLNTNNTSLEINIYDIQGRMMISKEISKKSSISLIDLSKGIYIYEVIDCNDVFTGKIIKE